MQGSDIIFNQGNPNWKDIYRRRTKQGSIIKWVFQKDVEYTNWELHEKRKKLEETYKKAYAMIFTRFFLHYMQTRVEEHPKYDSIINDTFKLIYAISPSTHEPIRSTYPYLSLTYYLSRMMHTRQQNKEVSLECMYGFKLDKSIVKFSIEEKTIIVLSKQQRNLRNLMKWMMYKK